MLIAASWDADCRGLDADCRDLNADCRRWTPTDADDRRLPPNWTPTAAELDADCRRTGRLRLNRGVAERGV
jgi:hypothetical protein